MDQNNTLEASPMVHLNNEGEFASRQVHNQVYTIHSQMLAPSKVHDAY